MGMHYVLRDTPAHADPLGPENTLVLAVGVLTGAPIAGQSRMTSVAKSPLSGAIGDSQSGGLSSRASQVSLEYPSSRAVAAAGSSVG